MKHFKPREHEASKKTRRPELPRIGLQNNLLGQKPPSLYLYSPTFYMLWCVMQRDAGAIANTIRIYPAFLVGLLLQRGKSQSTLYVKLRLESPAESGVYSRLLIRKQPSSRLRKQQDRWYTLTVWGGNIMICKWYAVCTLRRLEEQGKITAYGRLIARPPPHQEKMSRCRISNLALRLSLLSWDCP